MRTFKVIGECCLVFLAVLAVCVSLAFGYYHYFVHDTVTGVNYIGNQIPVDLSENVENLTSDEIEYYENRVLFEVNYFSNENNNGIELQEMKLDYFTDSTLSVSSCRSTGMQYLGDFETYSNQVDSIAEADNRVVEDFYYYDTTNMITWSGGRVATQLNRNSKLIIKIDDKAYMFQLTKKEETYSSFLFWTWLSHGRYWDYGDVFYDVILAVKTNSMGYGDYYITLNLSDYFTVTPYDYATGKWVDTNVADEIFTYAVCKFHFDENGARNSSQSLYGIIECNSTYDLEEQNIDTDYWQERMLYVISNNYFVYRYSAVYDGYFVSLSQDFKTLFSDMPRTKVNVIVDMVFDDNNIVGIDYNGFEDFEIDTLTVNGSGTFIVLDRGLFNSKLQTLKYSNDITFDIAAGSINSEYVEVIV